MKRLLAFMTFATMFSTLSVEFIAPFYAVFVGTIGGGLVLAGATWAVYRVGSAILMYFSGILADDYPAEHFMFAGFLLRIVGTAGYFLVSAPWHLLAVQLVHGMAHALIGPAYRKIYGKHLDGGHEAREWSYPQVGHELSMGIAAAVGGIVAAKFGFTWLFACMLTAHLAAALCAWRAWRLVRNESKPITVSEREVFVE